MTKHYVGIDLGGTNLKLGLVSAEGELLHRLSTPTESPKGPEHVLQRMADAVGEIAEGAGCATDDVAAVGVGIPGPVDTESGIVHFAPNLSCWTNIHVRESLETKLGCTIVAENDANSAAYGEFRVGAARDVDSMVILTLGTGVGGGIIQNGRLVRGASDMAAELGHLLVRYGGRLCGCGNRGCLEAYASATAVVERFRVEAGVSDLAHDPNLDCKAIFDAAYEGGDRAAARIVRETAEYLAVGITNILHALNPEMVVLTGGMMGAGERYLDEVRRAVGEIAFTQTRAGCTIQASVLGGDAGVIGTALAAEVFDRTGQLA